MSTCHVNNKLVVIVETSKIMKMFIQKGGKLTSQICYLILHTRRAKSNSFRVKNIDKLMNFVLECQ